MLQRYRGAILVAGLLAIAIIGTVIAPGSPVLSWMVRHGVVHAAGDAAVFFMDVAAVRSSGILDKLVGSTSPKSPSTNHSSSRRDSTTSGISMRDGQLDRYQQ